MTYSFGNLQLDLTVSTHLTYAQVINRRALPVLSFNITNQGTALEYLLMIPSLGNTPLAKKRESGIQPGETRKFDISVWTLPTDFPYPEENEQTLVFRLTLSGMHQEATTLDFNIRLMPRNMLCTRAQYADLIAAYVTPDCDALRTLVSEAARKSGTDPRAKMQAIYEAVRARKLPYMDVGAIFQSGYQPVYNAPFSLKNGGSCADLSLMFASLFCAAGLHPVLFLFNEHIFAGCWQTQVSFPTALSKDYDGILKLIDEGTLIPFECTSACLNADKDFDSACEKARKRLAKRDFVAIDVWKALSPDCGIQRIPLPGGADPIEEEVVHKPQNPITVIECPECHYNEFTLEYFNTPGARCPACGAPFKVEPPKPEPTPIPAPIRITPTGMKYSAQGAISVVIGGAKDARTLVCSDRYNGKPVTKVDPRAFADAAVQEVIFADSIETIGDQAFFQCNALTEVKLPANLKTLGIRAFAKCASLKRVVIPGTMKRIPSLAFAFCPSLKEVVIEEGVEIVASTAFQGCTGLETVTLPASIRRVERNAFLDCSALRSVEYLGESTYADPAAFNGCKLS